MMIMNYLLLFVLFISLIVALVTPTALGQEIVVPSWIKNNAEIIDGYFEKPVFIDTDFSNANLMNTIIDEPFMAGDIHSECKNNQICN